MGIPWRRLAAGTAAIAMVALAVRMLLPLDPRRTGEAFAATLNHVPEALRTKPVLNEYGLGGELIFQGVRPFIDSRADLYGDAFLTQYRGIVSGDRAAFDKAESEYGFNWTIFPAGHPMISLLDHEPGWRRLVEQDGVVIHAREP